MKVVLKRSILILFLTGNIIGLSYAQAAELEPVKLKKSCIKKKALLHKDLKCKAPLIEPNLRRNLGKWST
ncbi:hypothetical protein EA691_10005 [Acinetobacter baumannii]|nr:hypothetical protein EA711_17850 [Acinetobacter baumannii]RSR02288.1 hypothetical protein EA691_10005 [Acinetobacter baumannii]